MALQLTSIKPKDCLKQCAGTEQVIKKDGWNEWIIEKLTKWYFSNTLWSVGYFQLKRELDPLRSPEEGIILALLLTSGPISGTKVTVNKSLNWVRSRHWAGVTHTLGQGCTINSGFLIQQDKLLENLQRKWQRSKSWPSASPDMTVFTTDGSHQVSISREAVSRYAPPYSRWTECLIALRRLCSFQVCPGPWDGPSQKQQVKYNTPRWRSDSFLPSFPSCNREICFLTLYVPYLERIESKI